MASHIDAAPLCAAWYCDPVDTVHLIWAHSHCEDGKCTVSDLLQRQAVPRQRNNVSVFASCCVYVMVTATV